MAPAIVTDQATNDAGRTWRELPVPASVGADEKLGLQVIDETHAMLQLGRGLLATSNGGRTWRGMPLPQGQRVGFGAQFLDPQQGWYIDRAVYPGQSEQPTAMWWTSNGGASWSERWRVDAQPPQVGGVPLEEIKYVLGFRDRAPVGSPCGWAASRVVQSQQPAGGVTPERAGVVIGQRCSAIATRRSGPCLPSPR